MKVELTIKATTELQKSVAADLELKDGIIITKGKAVVNESSGFNIENSVRASGSPHVSEL